MKNTQDKAFMEKEAIFRLLVRFAGPSLVGMVANALYNIVDRIFVGQVVGSGGIAAIALAFPCMLFFNSAAALIGVGAASRISIQLGEKKRRLAEQTLGNAFSLAVALSAVFMLAGWLSFEKLLRLSGASDATLPMASEYLSIILWGVPCGIISFSLSNQIRACGSPLYAMGSQMFGAAANVVLDAWFVLGLDMGVKGAAIATIISQCVSMLWSLSYFWTGKAVIKLRLPFMLRPDPTTIARIFTVGTPACLVTLNFVLVSGFINSASSSYGGDLAVSATGIFMSMDSLLFMPGVAIADACQPIVGFNYGARRIDRVIRTTLTALLASSFCYITSFVAVMLFADKMAMLFNSSDSELISLAASALRVSYIGVPLMGLSVVTSSFLQGLGKGKEGFMLSIARFGIFLWVPLLTLPKRFGVYGAWGSFPVSDICGSITCLIFLVRAMKALKGADVAICPLSEPE
ncbi:MAG: MATE family efflux transporter [Synergistaceae bacterium]|jgi:putative MATE family efflux protein|nr:MATE family efflux transporter [Synergistaceae bacterium]